MTYTNLFPHLVANQFMKTMVLEPLTSPFLEWYNPDAHCEYHARVLGHSIEDCALSKDEVQKLIESGVLSFTVMEPLINEMDEEDRDTTLTISKSYIDVDGKAIECFVQSWEMINAAFIDEVKGEKKVTSLVGVIVERKHMVFPHLHETFYSARV